MNFKLYGAKYSWCQVPRIQQGLIGIGHSVIGNGVRPDVIYANNFPYSSIDSEHKEAALSNKYPNAIKIFNVLDIPIHINDFPIEQLKHELSFAGIVTCISEVVKKQLYDIGIDAYVIDNPIKDVFRDVSIEKDIDCLYVGRGTDPVKRSYLLELLFPSMISVGPFSGFGNHIGLVNDIQLNELYNRAKIVPLPSIFEGLGLTVLEAMVCGAVPIVCADNPNSVLCPEFCICSPDKEEIYKTYQNIIENFHSYQEIILNKYACHIQHKYSKFTIAQNIINLLYKERY